MDEPSSTAATAGMVKQRRRRTKGEGRRVNLSTTQEVQKAIHGVQQRLAAQFGFEPSVTQTLLWIVARIDSLIDADAAPGDSATK